MDLAANASAWRWNDLTNWQMRIAAATREPYMAVW